MPRSGENNSCWRKKRWCKLFSLQYRLLSNKHCKEGIMYLIADEFSKGKRIFLGHRWISPDNELQIDIFDGSKVWDRNIDCFAQETLQSGQVIHIATLWSPKCYQYLGTNAQAADTWAWLYCHSDVINVVWKNGMCMWWDSNPGLSRSKNGAQDVVCAGGSIIVKTGTPLIGHSGATTAAVSRTAAQDRGQHSNW